MARWEFLTVADELLGIAIAAADFYDSRGYTVIPEARALGYPFTPTLRCKRQSTTTFVEVSGSIPLDRLKEWAAFGKSSGADTRVVLAVSESVNVTVSQQMVLRALGVGLLALTTSGVSEVMPPPDLAMNVELPDISKDSKRLRAVLGPVYEHFERNQWREGFEEACVALESRARVYLWKAIDSGRTAVLTDAGKAKKLTEKKVLRMTMGELAGDFSNMTNPNHADSVIGKTLKQLNKDRVRVAHKKRTPVAERALRKNVGGQMWKIVGALREMHS